MSSYLIVMNWKQRLLQVGTCIVSKNSPRRYHFQALSNGSLLTSTRPTGSLEAHHNCCNGAGTMSVCRGAFSPLKVPGSVAGGSVHPLCSRSISTLSSRGGPLLSTMAAPSWRRRKAGSGGELPKLLEGGRNEFEEELDAQHMMQSSEKPVITVPVHLEKRLERRMEKESRKHAIQKKIVDASRKGGRKAQIIIHCKNYDLHHYHGQSYSSRKGDVVPLASKGWRHKKSPGDFFTLFPGFKRESPFFQGEEAVSFNDLGICEPLCENLKTQGIQQPTHIQMFGIRQILEGKRTLVAAETGCGKTLVYLLPIINQILQEKRYRARAKTNHPSAIILVPSRELADQIYEVALQLTYNLDVKVKVLQGGGLRGKMANPPSTMVDVLVATTNAVKVLSSAGSYGLSKVLHVVLDEADTLLDDSFFPDLVGPFLNRFPWSDLKRDMQLTLVSATMPKGLNSTIGEIMKTDNFYNCTTPGLHTLLPHVPQTFIRLRKSQKADKIVEIVKQDMENNIPVIIFCNKSKTCDWLSSHINDNGTDCVSVHGRMPLKYRSGRVDVFKRGEINVLISTDLASRGLDIVRTQHVINYEFPLYIADYIHRCGRTGRVGSAKHCRVTNFIARPGEVNTVNEIELSVRKEKSLPSVNANIKRLYGQHYGSFVEIQPILDEDDEKKGNPVDYENEDDESEDEEEEEEEEEENSSKGNKRRRH